MEARGVVSLPETDKGQSKRRPEAESWKISVFGKLEEREESEETKKE